MGKSMRVAKIVAAFVVIFIVVVSTALIYDAMLAREAASFAPMKDDIMVLIASNHADAEVFITGINLTYVGQGTFEGGGWILTISGGALNGTATADFSIARTQNSTGIPHRILWSGTITNGTIVEASYSHAV